MNPSLPWKDLDDDLADQQRRVTDLLRRVPALVDRIESETRLVREVQLAPLPVGRASRRALRVSLGLHRERFKVALRHARVALQLAWVRGMARMAFFRFKR